jgi:photosystem II stability/assembly factor-like uncharacterized protein
MTLPIQTMKKTLFVSFILMQFCLSLPAWSQWVATDTVESDVVNFSTSGGFLYACSATSGVYISSDSGYNIYSSNEGLGNLNTRIILPKDSLLVLGTNNSIYKSIDYGASWTLASNGFPTTGDHSNVTGIIFRGDSILVATYGNGIYCSIDFCESWFPLNNGFIDLYRSGLYINGKRLFTGTMYGGSGIYASDNGGATWVQKNNGVPMNPYAPDQYVDIKSFTNIGSTLFVATYGGNVLKSEDNGDSWIVLDCPNNYAWDIINVDNSLFCSHAGVGITESDDMGETWVFRNEGLGPPFDLSIEALYRSGPYLYIGTHAKKIFRRPVAELITKIPEQSTCTEVLVYPNPVSDISRIVIPPSSSGKYTLEIYNELGLLVKHASVLGTEQFEIRKPDFPTGMYFFRVIGSYSGFYSGKFIVL